MGSMAPSSSPLPVEQLNVEQPISILLIHGAFSSHAEWNMVTPHLTDYHLLLVDLPNHGADRHIHSFSRETAIDLLAEIIRRDGKGGTAHLMGFSLGASIAVRLASKYPGLVKDLFVSGFPIFDNSTAIVAGMWFEAQMSKIVPKPIQTWLMSGVEMSDMPSKPYKWKEYQELSDIFSSDHWPATWNARTLIIAAGKSGLLPTNDNLDNARRLRDIGRQSNPATAAYVHPDMRHPWLRQDPQLWATTAKAWFHGGTLPTGFREL
nr:putative 2-succinyl-6-hydroxy-2,4-cyclohexadiene-1-carboxylate synthase [Quercus suber]